MGKITNDNFVVVKGWMVTELGLKGSQLMLYAIIHGFSQDNESSFKGSISYLSEFAGISYESCRINLNELVAKGYLAKEQGEIGGSNYYRTIDIGDIPKAPKTPQNEADKAIVVNEDVKAVIDYLNEKAGCCYKYTKTSTTPIQARLREGFTVDDCKAVIDNKCETWLSSSKMKPFLRPQTLFGSKFEGYLNEKQQATNASYNIEEYQAPQAYKRPVYRAKEE